MLGFDESAFVKQIASAVALRPQIEELVDTLVARGFDNLFLIGAGGTYAAMWPYEHFAKTASTLPVKSVIAAELLVSGDKTLTDRSVAIFTSVSGTTDDSLRAIEYVKERGVLTVAFTGFPDSPIAQQADIALVSEPKTWPFDMQMMLFTTRLLSVRGEFDGYEKFAGELEKLPEILVEVAKQAEPIASDFADVHKDTDYYFLVGGGNLWGFTYLYSMCILEEMQWLRTTRVHSAEFFHGSLELLEKDTSLILFQGEDETRALTDRVERFVRTVSDDVTVFDTKDYPLEGISPEFRGLLAPVVLDTITGRVSKHLERVREHSLDLRRYYRVVEY
ncbi:silent information regulator protein Sir2 [Agreia sp. Leaf335]|nr:silent information regulator protein Sir2 [Agreia sp. Leaf335]